MCVEAVLGGAFGAWAQQPMRRIHGKVATKLRKRVANRSMTVAALVMADILCFLALETSLELMGQGPVLINL